jgi:hypothetical protein
MITSGKTSQVSHRFKQRAKTISCKTNGFRAGKITEVFPV